MILGIYTYIMINEHISVINPSNSSMCLPHIVDRQRLGIHVTVAMDTHNNRRIVGGDVY
jgi:hypothetical protein